MKVTQKELIDILIQESENGNLEWIPLYDNGKLQYYTTIYNEHLVLLKLIPYTLVGIVDYLEFDNYRIINLHSQNLYYTIKRNEISYIEI